MTMNSALSGLSGCVQSVPAMPLHINQSFQPLARTVSVPQPVSTIHVTLCILLWLLHVHVAFELLAHVMHLLARKYVRFTVLHILYMYYPCRCTTTMYMYIQFYFSTSSKSTFTNVELLSVHFNFS